MDDAIFKNPQKIEMDELQEFILRTGDIGIMWEKNVQEYSILPSLFLELHFASLVEERYDTVVPDRWYGYTEYEIDGKLVRCVRFFYLKEHPEKFPELKEFLKLKTRTEYEMDRLEGPAIIMEQLIGSGAVWNFNTVEEAKAAFEEKERKLRMIEKYSVERSGNTLTISEYYYYSDCYMWNFKLTLAL